MSDPLLITIKEACHLLSISRTVLYQLVRRGEIKLIQVPGIRAKRISFSDLKVLAMKWQNEYIQLQEESDGSKETLRLPNVA